MTYVLDANIVSYFIQENTQVISKFRSALEAGESFVISPVTYYEIMRGFKHKSSPKKEKSFTYMCSIYPIGEMSFNIWEKAADIYGTTRQAGNPIEDTDILIAAFCIENGYKLVTNNAKHFDRIDGLEYVNWME